MRCRYAAKGEHILRHYYALLFSGAYRILWEDQCTRYSVASGESKALQDGDIRTCESLHSHAADMFGIFFKEACHRSVVITVYGHGISCSPVDGIGLNIISNNYQIYRCKAYKMKTEDVCQYKCLCPVNGCCNRVAMFITSVAIASEKSHICETKISRLLRWLLQRNIM